MSFKPFKYALLAAGFGSAALLPFWSFAESAPAPKRERTEIHFSADQVEENSETKVITATGNVNIVREGTTLKADKITYDRKTTKSPPTATSISFSRTEPPSLPTAPNWKTKCQKAQFTK